MKNILTLTIPLITLTESLSACPRCRAQAAAGIYNADFGLNFFFMLLPILILAALGFGLYYVDDLLGNPGRR
jgi:hypothetical protein